MITHGVDGSHGKPTTARNAELFKINNQEKFKKLRYQLMFCCEIETLETHLLVALCEGCVEKFIPIVINSIISHNHDQSLLSLF